MASRSCAAQGSTPARVHPGNRRSNRSHLVFVRALGVPSSLTCPRDLSSRRRSPSHFVVVHASRGRCRARRRETLSRLCPLGSAAAAAATSPSCAPQGAAAARVPSVSDVATAPTSPSCVPHGGAATMPPRFVVARLLPESVATVWPLGGGGRNRRRR
jgi:hypothetical protein